MLTKPPATFFRTKYFIISAIVAALIVGGAAGAYYSMGVGSTFGMSAACEAPTLPGLEIGGAPLTLVEDAGKRRTETLRYDAAAFSGGDLHLCAAVGEIIVEPASGSALEIVWVIKSDTARSTELTSVQSELRNDGGRLILGAWEEKVGRESGWFDGQGANVRLTVRLPESGAYEIRAHTDVGNVHVTDLRASHLRAGADVGSVVVKNIDLEGNASLAADVGDVIGHFTSVQSGNITARADVGNADIQLPQRADVGYAAFARADVGQAVVRIGETESYVEDDNVPGGTIEARSSGFGAKPTRVTVHVVSDVGDARIVAS